MKLMPAYRRDTYYQDINALAIDPQDTTTIYAATRGGGIYKSTNAAESWDQVNSGLTDVEDPLGILGKIGAHAIAIDPTNPQIIYSSTTERGVFKSTNGGQRWANTHLTLRKDKLSTGMFGSSNSITATTLAVDPKNPTTIYAGLAGTGVYKSSNAGETWEPVNSGLGSAGIVVRTLTIDPQNPGTIYGGTQRGVIRTLNGGQNWEFINSGLHLVDNLDPVSYTHLSTGPQHPRPIESTQKFRRLPSVIKLTHYTNGRVLIQTTYIKTTERISRARPSR